MVCCNVTSGDFFFLEWLKKEPKVDSGLKYNGSDFILTYNFFISSAAFLQEQRHEINSQSQHQFY